MARRRMFSKAIIDSDAFLDMPVTTQLLYFHLSMRADDDGFINKPKSIMRACGGNDDDMKILIAKKFIIPFESGIVVIKHWKIHNLIAKDRYTETTYKEEKATLMLDEKNAYTLCIQDVNKMETQVRLGKVSQGEVRVVEGSVNGNEENDINDIENTENVDKDVDNSTFEFLGGTLGKGVVLLTPEQSNALLDKLGIDAFNHYVDKLSTFIIEKEAKVGNHYLTILKWAKEDMMI